MDQVMISRDGEDAIIEWRNAVFETTHLRIGPEVTGMADEEILILFNRVIAAGIRHRDERVQTFQADLCAGGTSIQSSILCQTTRDSR